MTATMRFVRCSPMTLSSSNKPRNKMTRHATDAGKETPLSRSSALTPNAVARMATMPMGTRSQALSSWLADSRVTCSWGDGWHGVFGW